jgi:hypothetical protein
MKKTLLAAILISMMALLSAQTYFIEDFEQPFTGTYPAPPGWVQYSTVDFNPFLPNPVIWQQNTWNAATMTWTFPRGITPPNGAFSGNSVLWIDDIGIPNTYQNGVWCVRSPILDLSMAGSPFVRFWYFNADNPGLGLKLHLMVSGDGGMNWHLLSVIVNGFTGAANSWNQISIPVPPQYITSQFCFNIEIFNLWGAANNPFIDFLRVEEHIPMIINSAQSGDWNNPATWAGGMIPTCADDVVISTGHTVTVTNAINNPGIIARCRDLIIDPGATLDYGPGTANLLQAFGNILVEGTLNAFNGMSGRMVYCGGDFMIGPMGNAVLNVGNIQVQPMWVFMTPGASGIVFLNCQPANYMNFSGLPIVINNILHIDDPRQDGSFFYESPVTVPYTFGLYLGTIDPNGMLVLGHPPDPCRQAIEIDKGTLMSPPIWDNTNVIARDYNYRTVSCLPLAPEIIPTGFEIEMDPTGLPIITGVLTMDTFNNLQLAYPLRVGTETTGGLNLVRGVIIAGEPNVLTLSCAVPGEVDGVDPGLYPEETHGSYVVGKLRRDIPLAGAGIYTFPLGLGTELGGADPTPNVLKQVNIYPGMTGGQSPTVSILGPPSGPVNPPLANVVGNFTYLVELDGGPDFPPEATLGITVMNHSPGNSDDISILLDDLRIAQAPTQVGTWSEVSAMVGTGPVYDDMMYPKTTDYPIAPLGLNGGYFAWASAATFKDLAALGIAGPSEATVGIPSFFDVTLINLGTSTETDFTIELRDPILGLLAAETFEGFPVGPGDTVTCQVQWIPMTPGAYDVQGLVVLPGDEDPSNDMTGILPVSVYAPLSLPFIETWEPTAIPYWTFDPNWSVDLAYGNPEPSAIFSGDPPLFSYYSCLTTKWLDATGAATVRFRYDATLQDSPLPAVGGLSVQFFYDSQWWEVENLTNSAGSIPWSTSTINMTPWLAGKIFRLRFVSYGQDSADIMNWHVDNIRLEPFPVLSPPDYPEISGAGGIIEIDWDLVPEAEAYIVYHSDDPFLPFPVDWTRYPGTYLPPFVCPSVTPAEKMFFRVSSYWYEGEDVIPVPITLLNK